MTREDIASSLLLGGLALGLWWTSATARTPSDAWGEMDPPGRVSDRVAAPFRAGPHAFRMSVPAGWAWVIAESRAIGQDGWRPLGRFSIGSRAPRGGDVPAEKDAASGSPPPPDAAKESIPGHVEVAWRRLPREVRVEDWLEFELQRTRRSVTRLRPAEGRRPRLAVAETWIGEGPAARPGVLALFKLGDRLYRLDAHGVPGDGAEGRSILLDAVMSFQPIGPIDTGCAESLSVWRPLIGEPLTVRYPAGWDRAEAFRWQGRPALDLRSRGGGERPPRLLLCALDPKAVEEETLGARIDELLAMMEERDPGLGVAGARVRADHDSGTDRMPGPGRLRILAGSRNGRPWEIRVRILRGKDTALGIVVLGPERESDAETWMVQRAAFDVVADLAREE